MEEVKEKVERFIAKEVEVTTFIANDGRRFENKNECLNHEKEKKFESNIKKFIPIRNGGFLEGPYCYYYAYNNDELEWILNRIGYYNTYDSVSFNGYRKGYDKRCDKPKIKTWIGSVYEDGGDTPGSYNITTLTYIKERINQFLKESEEILKWKK